MTLAHCYIYIHLSDQILAETATIKDSIQIHVLKTHFHVNRIKYCKIRINYTNCYQKNNLKILWIIKIMIVVIISPIFLGILCN